ncbi:unnamed protein product [Chondrus crispus]|uniref:Uncharacterized protein n=1 Tax=Chondrus crispus TaxID=2769 RepID=R7QIG7_CHOCR|nr:unnamed protein product [Chondrus crispus]CDF37528.1 unnamed protein product [Chondrus crispus]|eukprot:XP_005717399.1 unnamed protein product [Chondrus crispus]
MQRTLQLAGAFYRARPVKQAGATMARGRNLACAASPRDGAPPARKAGEIMGMAANKATRFVYLRTLPLVKQPELEGQVDEVAGRIEDMTARLCEKHGGALVDERSAVHLHTAALAIATHRVLEPRIRDEWRLGNVIRAGYGAKLVPARDATEADRKAVRVTERLRPDFWVVRAALWMSFNRMKAIRKMTSNMARDFGQSFETTSTDRHGDEGETHSLLVSK